MNKIIIPYRPRPLQKGLHDIMARFSVVVCHRRFGKTVMAVNKLIKGLIRAKQQGLPRPRAVYVAPLYRQAKQIAWDYAKFYCGNLPGYKPNESELRVDFLEDCRLFFIGADNPDSIRGIYADEVVLDEYAQMNPKMWSEVLRPALTDRKGSAMFIGTPKGKNVFWELWKHGMGPENLDWSSHMFRASETGYVDEAELLAAKNDMTEEEYAQEYECSWEAAIKGAYYGKLMEILTNEGRVLSVPWESTLEVHTAWDLGIDDLTAIWFYQQADRDIRLINYYENSGAGLDHYVNYLKKQHYVYGRHFLPHDVKVKELSTGRSRLEMLRGLGINAQVVQKTMIDDGINAVRAILPRCYFDAKKCERGIEALRQYKTEFNDKTGTFRQRPYHDWTSHGADAFRYLAVSLRDKKNGRRQTRTISNYDIFDPDNRRQIVAEGTEWHPW
jgi:phage terminase large subunit